MGSASRTTDVDLCMQIVGENTWQFNVKIRIKDKI